MAIALSMLRVTSLSSQATCCCSYCCWRVTCPTMEMEDLDKYTDAIACMRQTLQEGKKESNVNINLMLANITRCESIVQKLEQTQQDPLHKHALTSLTLSLAANRNVLARKIQQLSVSKQPKPPITPRCSASSDSGDGGGGEDTVKEKEKRSRQMTIEETIVQRSDITLRDVVGLAEAKQALKEAVVMPLVFPHLFQGGRKPWKRLLLYGPPGTGKTRLAQAIAAEVQSTFYSVSSADIISSWVGESEKLIKELFSHAVSQPGKSVIFIDEIDSLCRQRNSREDEHTRRMKTELLKQMEGADTSGGSGCENVFLMCATNCPWELDSAFLRRFQKRIYIPLPDRTARMQLMKLHSQSTAVELCSSDWETLGDRTEGYSGSDLATLTMGALFQPIRDMQTARHWRQLADGRFAPCSADQQGAIRAKLSNFPPDKVTPRDVDLGDFVKSITAHQRTVSSEELGKFQHFRESFGEMCE